MSRFSLPLTFLFIATTAFTQPASTGPQSGPSAEAQSAPPRVGTADPERFFQLFLPFQTENAAISPDGKHLAYSLREGNKVSIVVVAIDNPSTARAKVVVATDETSTPTLMDDTHEKTPARVRWLGWGNANRLIVETNSNLSTMVGENWVNTSGAILAFNVDGSDGRVLVTPKDLVKNTSELKPETTNSPSAVRTPDMPEPDAETGEDIFANTNDPADVERGTSNLPTDKQSPRSPTFFDFDPKKPDHILIRTSDPKDYGLFAVNIANGKLTYGPMEKESGDYHILIDRQGRQSAVVPSTTRSAFPHRYMVAKSGFGVGRWTPLDKISKIPDTRFSVSPENYLGERSIPIGFDENPDILYYASNVGRDTYGIYSINLKTGERLGKPVESPRIDLIDPPAAGFLFSNPLVFDRYTRQLAGIRYQDGFRKAIWLRPEIQQVQTELDTAFPHYSIDILGWDESANRFLAYIRSTTDAGGYYIFDRSSAKLMEFVRCAPWIDPNTRAMSIPFQMPHPAGGSLSGLIAIPRAVRQKPIPTIVICADEPWQRTSGEFHNEMNALAAMGFVVVQINPRGTWGFGIKHRLQAQDAFDEVQVEDILIALDALATAYPINTKRVALMGHERGGYLALRALQLRPDRFRCAIGINPTVDLASWLAEARWTSGDAGPALARTFFGEKLLKQNALLDNPKSIKRPVFILSYYGPDGGPIPQRYLTARRFISAVNTEENPAIIYPLSTDYMRGLPGAHSDAMRRIEDFLNENIYAYNVQLGETTIEEQISPTVTPPAKK